MPVRHGRMMVSPFTFYRGAAKIMAADLEGTPVAGLDAQLCGDAHLSNFGAFASPERQAAVRPERLRRDAAGAVRVRREADGGELHDRGPQQRFLHGGRARGDAGVGDGLPGGHGLVRADGHDGHLVRPPGRGRAQGLDPQRGGRDGRSRRRRKQAGRRARDEEGRRRRSRRRRRQGGARSGRRRRPRRLIPATACRRCPSSASWSMAGTGSSASRRSSSRSATGPPPTGCPPIRLTR